MSATEHQSVTVLPGLPAIVHGIKTIHRRSLLSHGMPWRQRTNQSHMHVSHERSG